jgi:hypothetical protein
MIQRPNSNIFFFERKLMLLLLLLFLQHTSESSNIFEIFLHYIVFDFSYIGPYFA